MWFAWLQSQLFHTSMDWGGDDGDDEIPLPPQLAQITVRQSPLEDDGRRDGVYERRAISTASAGTRAIRAMQVGLTA